MIMALCQDTVVSICGSTCEWKRVWQGCCRSVQLQHCTPSLDVSKLLSPCAMGEMTCRYRVSVPLLRFGVWAFVLWTLVFAQPPAPLEDTQVRVGLSCQGAGNPLLPSVCPCHHVPCRYAAQRPRGTTCYHSTPGLLVGAGSATTAGQMRLSEGRLLQCSVQQSIVSAPLQAWCCQTTAASTGWNAATGSSARRWHRSLTHPVIVSVIWLDPGLQRSSALQVGCRGVAQSFCASPRSLIQAML